MTNQSNNPTTVVACPKCYARVGHQCVQANGKRVRSVSHKERVEEFRKLLPRKPFGSV
jgi:hypothetical protein